LRKAFVLSTNQEIHGYNYQYLEVFDFLINGATLLQEDFKRYKII